MGCSHKILIRQIGNRHKTDMAVLAIKSPAGQRLVEILEPVSADKVGVIGYGVQIARIGGAAFAFSANADQPLQNRPLSIDPKWNSPINAGLPSP